MSDAPETPPAPPVKTRKRPYRRRPIPTPPAPVQPHPGPVLPSPDGGDPALTAQPTRPRIIVTPRSEESTWSADDIIESRLTGQNPFGRVNDNSLPLRNKAAWHQRWFNNQVNPSQVHLAQRRLGWVPVRVEDLEDGTTPESLGLTVAPDGTIRRGDRNTEEVILKMPEASYQAIQQRKTEMNTQGMRSEKAAKAEVAAAAAGTMGDQAADYIAKHGNISIRDRVTGS